MFRTKQRRQPNGFTTKISSMGRLPELDVLMKVSSLISHFQMEGASWGLWEDCQNLMRLTGSVGNAFGMCGACSLAWAFQVMMMRPYRNELRTAIGILVAYGRHPFQMLGGRIGNTIGSGLKIHSKRFRRRLDSNTIDE